MSVGVRRVSAVSDFFHGGYPGIAVGDWVLSPDDSGTEKALSNAARVLGHPWGVRRDVVYASPHEHVARVFAAMYPDGSLYRVELDTIVGDDPDAPACGIMARRARVIEVVRKRVEFVHRTPRSWLTMLTRACEHTKGTQ